MKRLIKSGVPLQEMKRTRNDLSFEKIKKHRGGRFTDPDTNPEDRENRSRTRDFRKTKPATENFRCKKCRAMIGRPPSGGSQRNHCPLCLYSIHVDFRPGDRSAECGSSMEPISIWVRGGEWVLLHRCMGCGVIHSNRIAADDNEIALMSLAARPLGRPAFPLYEIQEREP